MSTPLNPYSRYLDESRKIILAGEITSRSVSTFFERYNGGTVFLSSIGGDIGSMLAIFDHIKSYDDAIVVATGVNQSAAAVLLQAGKTRIMSRNAILQFIPPPENRDIEPQRWFLHSNLANLVRERTGMALPESYDLFDEQMINAERALQLGLIDKIEGREDNYVDPNDPANWSGVGEIELDRLSGGEGSSIEPEPELPEANG